MRPLVQLSFVVALAACAAPPTPNPPSRAWSPLVPRDCSFGACRFVDLNVDADPAGGSPLEPRPQVLAPWLEDARKVNSFGKTLERCGADLHDTAAQLSDVTGLAVECSPALREESQRGARSPWSEGGGGGMRAVDALNVLARSRFHPKWTLEQGVITLIAESEFAAAVRRADQDPRNAELAQLRSRVRVHWDEPELHALDLRADDGEATRRSLRLGGRLGFIDEAGKESPLTWPLSARLLLARRADIRPNWSSEPSSEDTCLRWIACEGGRFAAHVDLDQLERVPGQTRDFQIGLALPDLQPGGTWRRTSCALPQCVELLAIPGPAVLDADLAVINACVANDGLQYDPVAYVRAVNHLRKLGKQRALERMREYAKLVPSNGFAVQSPIAENSDNGNAACIFGIVRLLFDFDRAAFVAVSGDVRRAKGFDRAVAVNGFAMWTGMVSPRPYEVQSYPGDQCPFVVVDGLPFFAPEWLPGRTGYDPTPMDAIDWAEEHGQLRNSDLRPTDDPIGLVEQLELRVGALPKGNFPRLQIARLLGPLVGFEPTASYVEGMDAMGNTSDHFVPTWSDQPVDLDELKRALVTHGGVHWDEVAQRYALGPRQG